MAAALFLTPRQFAEKVGKHIDTVRDWCRSGALKVSRTPGGHIMIPRTEIDRLMSGDATPQPTRAA